MVGRRIAVAVLVLLGLSPVRTDSMPQNPPSQVSGRPSGAVVLGKVLDGPGGAGIADAVVQVYSRQAGPVSAVWTDALGQFVFFNVPDGTYELMASKPGYVRGNYGQRAPQERGREFVVSGARAPSPITISVWKAGEITGRVTDENGEPLAGWPVQVMAKFARGGRVQWVAQASGVVTDDRGRYRVGDIYPGDYLLMVKPAISALESNGEVRSYAPLIHPAASTISTGIPFTIAVREEIAGMDFRVRSVVAHRIAGRITGSAAPAGLTVRLTAWDDDAAPELELGRTRTGRTGEFVFPAVPQGVYRVAAWNRDDPANGSVGVALADDYGGTIGGAVELLRPPHAFLRVVVSDTDLTSISIPLPGMVEIVGRYVFRGTTPPSSQVVKGVTAFVSTPAGDIVGTPRTTETGTFRLSVAPGAYLVGPPESPSGWAVDSITVAGRPTLDIPIVVGDGGVSDVVVTFTDKVAEVTGIVRASDGGSLPADLEAKVLIFPTDQARWVDFGAWPQRIRGARVTPTGAFTVQGLPAGDYFMIAMSALEAGDDWQLATNFAKLSRAATRVQVPSEGKANTDLRVWSGR